jgi:NAD(P) transhydrogenase subunit alpha
MFVSVPKETVPGERRVALVPDLVSQLIKLGMKVLVQKGAGSSAGFLDSAYQKSGADIEMDVIAQGDVLLKVQPPALTEIDQMKPSAALISFLQPYANVEGIRALAGRKIAAFALELIPRITRAQAMDALSAMSTVSGYKAVLIAAQNLPRFFPLLMTAAGTVTPARVFIIGAGVAGLQAIGTAKRLGAVVEAFDTRPAVKEQVESLGAKFLELALETTDVEAKTGYAKAQSEEFYKRQREMMLQCVAGADVVITTALVPGQRAPVLITEDMVQAMRTGSIIVDLAAEQGGNCTLTQPGQEVVRHGVTIFGPLNLPSTVPFHASQMYARVITNFLAHLVKDGKLQFDLSDELTRAPLVTYEGKMVNEVVKGQIMANDKAF